MEASKIFTEFRRQADDRVEPYHFKAPDLFDWLSEAEREASVRGRLIYDRSTPAITRIDLVPGQAEYALSPLWFDVDDVWVDRSPLLPGHRPHRLDRFDTAQRNGRDLFRGSSRLNGYAVDGRKLTVFPVPDDSYGTSMYPSFLRIAGYRLPLYDIEDEGDEPEIPDVHHEGLVHWMLYRAFSSPDGETADPSRAATAYNLFEAAFGSRPSANTLRMQAEGRRWTTRPATYP